MTLLLLFGAGAGVAGGTGAGGALLAPLLGVSRTFLPVRKGISRTYFPPLVGRVTAAPRHHDWRLPVTAQNQMIEMWTGDDVTQPFIIVDENDVPEPVGTYTQFTFTVREEPLGAPIFTPKLLGATGIVAMPGGLLYVYINKADTQAVDVAGYWQDFVHELEGVKPVGGNPKVRTLATGIFRLHKSLSAAGAAP